MTSTNKNSLASTFLISLALAGCTTTTMPSTAVTRPLEQPQAASASYTAETDEKFPVPEIDASEINPRNLRKQVNYRTPYPPGTIVVDTKNRFVYLVQEGGKAIRYGVGVGREGLEFTGTANIAWKQAWPRWTPTPDMIRRDPQRYARWADGMEGGPQNPLGARALYLFKNGKDTLFRIHGTNEPQSIGHAVSSGCIRMMNQDVIDLYRRVPPGTKVVVL
ncbi:MULTISPECIES: L,D-transpeptidase [unclassified Rhizobium]|jgi:lipoprotein-anchoring transpeptidase ErfK/SrfK|uniref:L,D-transpeptidase n=1 Tax=unclassified Rhizobium TaxID=2613769 RepID=UPI000646192F|nr:MULTISPECIES: L,D-transpeptidase [unclassified Rhizobium]OJY74129.1 MAG: L,D-transpeptidase [Rhizobium sp. 60-20]RKD61437.1 lipoprotein-anchoring transpeptidase ErfK/SrfK [Rhizobium sp. WW_1]